MKQAVDSIDAQTKTSSTAPALRGHIYTMAAAFAGVIFGVLGSMGFVGNYLQSQFAAQNAAMNKHFVTAAPADSVSSACYAPTGSATSGNGFKTASTATTTPAWQDAGGKGGDGGTNGGSNNGGGKGGDGGTFVHQMINGTISNTGPHSNNSITASNSYSSTTTNNNDVDVSNNSSQSANSGNASTSGNTTGGSASTGDAHNQNDTSTTISIKN